VGGLLGRTGTSDIADAHVVLTARLHHGAVATGDVHDLRRLDPRLELIEL
jgi:hypothetical protein